LSIFKHIEELLFTGRTVKDYGVVDESEKFGTDVKQSIILVEKDDEKKLIIKTEYKALFGWSVQYIYFDSDGIKKLKECVDDAATRI
jgi:hypothetical protein